MTVQLFVPMPDMGGMVLADRDGGELTASAFYSASHRFEHALSIEQP